MTGDSTITIVEGFDMPEDPYQLTILSISKSQNSRAVDVSGVLRDTTIKSADSVMMGALVRTLQSKTDTNADVNGVFHLKNVPINDTLEVVDLGYVRKRFPVDSLTRANTIPKKNVH